MTGACHAVLLLLLTTALGPAQRSAALHEAETESACRPDAVSAEGDIGLWQWRGPRAAHLRAWAARQRRDWRDPAMQIAFMLDEWPGLEGYHRFTEAGDTRSATLAWCRFYERRRCG